MYILHCIVICWLSETVDQPVGVTTVRPVWQIQRTTSLTSREIAKSLDKTSAFLCKGIADTAECSGSHIYRCTYRSGKIPVSKVCTCLWLPSSEETRVSQTRERANSAKFLPCFGIHVFQCWEKIVAPVPFLDWFFQLICDSFYMLFIDEFTIIKFWPHFIWEVRASVLFGSVSTGWRCFIAALKYLHLCPSDHHWSRFNHTLQPASKEVILFSFCLIFFCRVWNPKEVAETYDEGIDLPVRVLPPISVHLNSVE